MKISRYSKLKTPIKSFKRKFNKQNSSKSVSSPVFLISFSFHSLSLSERTSCFLDTQVSDIIKAGGKNRMAGRRVKGKDSKAITAVAIDKDKNSQHALKWALDHIVGDSPNCILLHVQTKLSNVLLLIIIIIIIIPIIMNLMKSFLC